jgi:hypothetical protein
MQKRVRGMAQVGEHLSSKDNAMSSKPRRNWVLVAHTCNPSYSRGRDQEDQVLKPAWANNLGDPVSKSTQYKNRTGLAEWLKQ